jgi:hypothetical protein
LLAYLQEASLGGQTVPAQSDDPRVNTEPVRRALRIYRGVFAPTLLYDDDTGAAEIRSHAEQIRQALQQAEDAYLAEPDGLPTGAGLLAFAESRRDMGEALFYLSAFADLAREAEQAGLGALEVVQFMRLLVRDVAPERLGVDGLVDAIPLPPVPVLGP